MVALPQLSEQSVFFVKQKRQIVEVSRHHVICKYKIDRVLSPGSKYINKHYAGLENPVKKKDLPLRPSPSR